MVTFHDTLGVSRYATRDEIKQAHRRIAINNHSDKTFHLTESEKKERDEITKLANNAWTTLQDSEKRAEYDEVTFENARKRPRSDSGSSARSEGRKYDSNSSNTSSTPPPRPRSPPVAHRALPPGQGYPNLYHFVKDEWNFRVWLGPHVKVLLWGSNRLWVDGDRIIFLAQVDCKVRDHILCAEKLKLTVMSTPGGYKVSSIESMFTHRENAAGVVESTLIVTLEAPPKPSNKTTPQQEWNWGWNLDVPVPLGTPIPVLSQCWMSLQRFYLEEPRFCEENPTPGWTVSRRRELQPCAMVDLGAAKRQIVSGGRNNPEGVMFKCSAMGYRKVKRSFGWTGWKGEGERHMA